MKVCQINCVYGRGSTGKIVQSLHRELQKNGHESIVICPTVKAEDLEANVFTVSNRYLSRASALYRRLFARQFDGALIQTSRILNILEKERPDVVHLHCINGNNINIYRLLRYLAKKSIKTILTVHAEFMFTGGCEHAYDCERYKSGCGKCPYPQSTQSFFFDGTAHTWKQFKKSYALFDKELFHYAAVSPWLEHRVASSPLLHGLKGSTVKNGIDTSVFHYCERESLREELGIAPDEKIVFHVAAFFDPTTDNIKGGKYVVELAKRLEGQKVRFVIAANRTVVSALPENVLSIGKSLSSEQLAEMYSLADVTLLTSKRETFSMPTAESLCCGTPVVGFCAGGPESIAITEYSKFVPYGDVGALEKALQEFLAASADKKTVSEQAVKTYSCETMFEEYMKLYTEKR